MKCVIDTNVFVATLMRPDGASSRLFRLVFSGKLIPVMGSKLLYEYEDVLNRDYLFTTSPLDEQKRLEFFMAVASKSIWADVHFQWRPNLADEGDNHILELAIASQSKHIITWNKRDFKSADLHFPQLTISTPTEFINLFTKE